MTVLVDCRGEGNAVIDPNAIILYDRNMQSSDLTSLNIRRIERSVKERLRIRAAMHGHSMEEEIRRILTKAAESPDDDSSPQKDRTLYEAVRSIVEPYGGFDLEPPPREDYPGEPDWLKDWT